MILQRLELRSFRQFRDAAIDFAVDDEQNVTIIHGQNGAGKTTILNAFTWLLYEEVTFENRPDRLANEGAMARAGVGDNVTAEVRLDFAHDGAQYTATRSVTYEKRHDGDYDGSLVDHDITVTAEEGGKTRQPGNPENKLDQIIPERLSDLFFFDGEDIDELSQFDNRDHVQEAIQNIMGLTILERATSHVEKVAGRFEDEAAEYGSDELRTAIEEKQRLADNIDDLETKRKDKTRAIEQVEGEINTYDQKLERFDESKALTKQRSKYENQIASLEAKIESTNTDLREQVDNNGFVTIGLPLIRETAEDLDDLRKQGEIPSRFTNDYINTLLENSECICGRPLDHRTQPYESVASLKGEVSKDGVDQAAIQLIGAIDQLSARKSEFHSETDRLIQERERYEREIKTLEEKIDSISGELQEMETTTDDGLTVGELETARAGKAQEKEELIEDRGAIKEQISKKQDTLEQKTKDIEELQDERAEALLARRRQKAAELVHQELDQSFAELRDTVREWSDRQVKATFDKIASKNYTAGIDENFSLTILRTPEDGERVAVDISTGERQIASLAFIGSLVQIARERYNENTEYDYFTGGIYPLVMDSPFGALDNTHRREVSRVIPGLGSQVIVLATDSQWEGPVRERMADRVGAQYWLDYKESGDQTGHPQTRLESEQAVTTGD
jgi:DNA sulfur modification protein DndD